MEPDSYLIETLEDLLEEARSGRIQSVLCVHADPDGEQYHIITPQEGDFTKELLGVLTVTVNEAFPETVSN